MESVRRLWAEDFPAIDSPYGVMRNVDLLPKPAGRRIPMLVTGNSRQSIPWIAEHGDGWLMYPRPLAQQRQITSAWHEALELTQAGAKPFSQSLYIDLVERPDTTPTAIHLGYRTGHRFLLEHLAALQEVGVNHVLINVKYGRRPVDEVLQELAEQVVPHFSALQPQPSGA
jgi:luciferase-type oxidoreductase